MLKRSLFPLTVALVVALAPTALRAQTNRLTLGGAFGGLSGAANLNPAGTAGSRQVQQIHL
jgi:hypothetical protein